MLMFSSTTSEIAARYQCDGKEVPKVLWRVRYTGQSLKAGAKPSFNTKQQFKRAVELHLNWSNRIPTPFVSLFDTREHAVQWARRHFELGYDDVFLLKIDAAKLGPVFRVRYLVQDSDIHTLLPESMYNDEFLALRKISRRSIIRETFVSCSDQYSSEDSAGRTSEESNEDDDVFAG
ncbi:hypothetical protein PF010_g7954 [Phytophthora fragariae]|uniref:DUF7587 domain-containing protein n=1 Tax=Phytophthora fragariae TaxID=53985 RepID=A0A6A3F8U4_9STRA|nr:hypothetical protein PF003_g22735 [Phytophthora fragariae]KAE8941713.1 hypothetical protein PF009_g8498 [Phytophthora fragariae]KAE9017876.1 hypothetical protein PF011_g6514 [Phytophthora fragariae]KAE9119195.1 hypothetical protein PF010_g7954 [Phytophthora fragariae]KAE9119973.1 hypothetical protein PF007_g8347 [Phytophthora fragariae]